MNLEFAGILQSDINSASGRLAVVTKAKERIKRRSWIRIESAPASNLADIAWTRFAPHCASNEPKS
jgi:hypothetical protein